MKNAAVVLLVLLLFTKVVTAQSPQKFSFQGVARNQEGKVLPSGSIVPSIRFTIHKGSANGSVEYDEIHTNVPVSFGGVFNLDVGGGSQVVGSVNTIEWSKDSHFLQVQCDFGDGAVYDLGSVQLLSVPYAQHATTAASWIQDDPVVQKGTLLAGGTITPPGEGPRLIWYPRKAAFRVGLFHESDNWGDADIGNGSFSSGEFVRASGFYSAAFGFDCQAKGVASITAGWGNQALGSSSLAIGSSLLAKAISSATFGQFNNDQDFFEPGGLSPLDRLFQIGNGSGGNSRSNALTVLRNGNVGIGNNSVNPTHTLDIGGRARIRHKGGSTAGMYFDNSVGVPTGFVGMVNDDNLGFYLGNWRLQVHSNGAVSTGGGNAIGDESAAFGPGVTAKAYGAVAVGAYNNVQDNSVATYAGAKSSDRIFQIGNGMGNQSLSSALTVLRNGNIGIGNDALFPTYLLEVGGRPRILHTNATAGIHFDNSQHVVDGFVGMKTDDQVGLYLGNSWKFWVDNGGTGYINNAVVQTSDRRLKRDFAPLSASLERLTKLNGYHYHWKDKERDQSLQTGLIAQDVEALFPELVKTDEKGFKSLNYTGLIPHLIESVKELRKQNAKLESENAAFRADNQAINQKLADIEARLGQLSASYSKATE